MVRSLPLPLSISQNTRGPDRPAFESATWLQIGGVAVGGMGVLVGGTAVLVAVGVLVGGSAVLVEEGVFVGAGGVLEGASGVGDGGTGVFTVVLVGGRMVAEA